METNPTTFLTENIRILQAVPLIKIIARKATDVGLSHISASFRKGSEIHNSLFSNHFVC